MHCLFVKTIKFMLLLIAILIALFFLVFFVPSEKIDIKSLYSGDIILQTHVSPQAPAVMAASATLYSHTGIIFIENSKVYVLESAGSVGRVPFKQWIGNGLGGRYSVYRHKDLVTDQQRNELLLSAKPYIDAPYDFLFLFDNEAIYCSELPYLMYKKIGIDIGRVEQVKDLYVNNVFVEKLIENRWKSHPLCQNNSIGFKNCYNKIMAQELVTPVSLADDKKTEKIYSNYLGGLL